MGGWFEWVILICIHTATFIQMERAARNEMRLFTLCVYVDWGGAGVVNSKMNLPLIVPNELCFISICFRLTNTMAPNDNIIIAKIEPNRAINQGCVRKSSTWLWFMGYLYGIENTKKIYKIILYSYIRRFIYFFLYTQFFFCRRILFLLSFYSYINIVWTFYGVRVVLLPLSSFILSIIYEKLCMVTHTRR